MKILGIETSCDETSISILEFDNNVKENMDIKVLANVVSTQIDIHKEYGGVVPEIASRQHIKNISAVLDEALCIANTRLEELCAIAVTIGPGLIGALLVGVSFAKALAYSLNIPVVPVHHIAGHISANFLTHKDLKPPFLSLVVSGGHSHVILVEDYTKFKILARTRDDACGEAFDKVARILGLGYPGGPEISKKAEGGTPTYVLPKTKFEDNLDYSFSGIKTAVMNIANKEKDKLNIPNMCASFENNVTEVLVSHALAVANEYNIKTICLAGGVSANRVLRKKLEVECEKMGYTAFLPELKYTTDNAAMIAAAGIFKYIDNKYTKNLALNAKANMNIEEE